MNGKEKVKTRDWQGQFLKALKTKGNFAVGITAGSRKPSFLFPCRGLDHGLGPEIWRSKMKKPGSMLRAAFSR